MTLATGKPFLSSGAGACRGRRARHGGFALDRRFALDRFALDGGFTLVEILVVLAIIVLLFSMVTVSVGTFYASAYEKSTKAMILRLRDHIETYKRITGKYPPDGIDFEVVNDEGTPIQGSAALHYFLTRPIIIEVIQGGIPKLKEYPPLTQQMAFKETELSAPDPGYPGAREIRDGWGDPLHYDNTENGEFVPQTGEVHIPPLPEYEVPPDARSESFFVRGEPAVPKPGEVQSRGFDLWSRAGQNIETENEEENAIPIATWNLAE